MKGPINDAFEETSPNGNYELVAKCLVILCSKLLMLSSVHYFLRYINMTAETYVGTVKEEAATAFN